jgi:hypothetical protein
LLLITLFLSKALISDQPLLAADLLFYLDPLWQPLAPPGFALPANQVLSDQVFEFYPWQNFIREELAAGRLPLWNPYVYSGHPLLANAQSALFDPFQMVARLWPLGKSFVVLAFLRLLCAGTFTLLLALELGLSRYAASVAMVVFTFALPQITWLLYPKASVLVWLPALLFLSLRLIRFGKWRDAAALALVMAAQLASGHPETWLYSMLIWLVFSTYWLWLSAKAASDSVEGKGREAERYGTGAVPYAGGLPVDDGKVRNPVRRAIVRLAVAALLGLGVGAIQWLPVAEALLQSEILAARSQPALTWDAIFFQWRDWLAALTMLMPDFFGNPRHHDYWFPYSNYTEQTISVGVLPLALALLLFLHREKGREVTFLLTLGVIMLALALRLPGLPLLAELPVLNVTNPARLRGIYMLVMALLAGYGLDLVRQKVSSGDLRYARWLERLVLMLGVVAAVIAAGAYFAVTIFQEELVELGRAQAVAAQGNPFFFRPLAEYLTLAEVRVEQMIASFHPANWTMYLPLLLAAGMLGLWALLRRFVVGPQLRAQLLSLLILLLVSGELWLFGYGYNPTMIPEDLYPTPELVDELLRQSTLEQDEPYRIVGTNLALIPNVGMLFGLEDVRGYDPIAPRRYMELVSRLQGVKRVGHHLLFTAVDAPFLDFLNVRFAFAIAAPEGRWQSLRESHGVTLYANTTAIPRAFMVYAGQIATTPAESLAMTLAPGFDFRSSVVLEGVAEPLVLGEPVRSPTVEIIRHVPGAMSVQVETAAAGILVVSDPYTTGWMARVDGQAAQIMVANHAFRAVYVPQGNHTVTFDYQPAAFALGAWVSGASLAILFLSILFAGRKGAL